MWSVDAAPQLLDDALFASPELALVDSQLAAQLRAEIVPGEAFQPRLVDRGEHGLRYDKVIVFSSPVDPPPDEPTADATIAAGQTDVIVVDALVEPCRPNLSPVADIALAATDERLVEGVAEVDYLALPEPSLEPERAPDPVGATSAGVVWEDPLLGFALDPTPTDASELPDYVIRGDDVGMPRKPPRTDSDAVEDLTGTDGEGVGVLEVVSDPVHSSDVPSLAAYDAENDRFVEDGLVSSEYAPWELAQVVSTDIEDVPPEVPAVPREDADVPDLPEYVVGADARVEEEPVSLEYPVLPDLALASAALEETDAALRRIREQLVSEETTGKGLRLRRRFTIASGFGALGAMAVFAVDVQQGLATVPSWLG